METKKDTKRRIGEVQNMNINLESNLQNMNPEKLHEFVNWLSSQLEHLSETINEAHDKGNFGREAQCEGMRDAFMRCLNKLTRE